MIVGRPWQGDEFRLYRAVMVTSSDNAGWPDDTPIGDHYRAAGLPNPSIVRPAKIVSVAENTASRLGRLPEPIVTRVRAAMDQVAEA
ncbi:MAG TPA: hypothetical protein VFQ64_12920 [Sphingomonas sp.]|nr:hypothetical protein [Sphingomonas sp.]HEU0045448.1 hypothetical protein [Sphingomonas sp.]